MANLTQKLSPILANIQKGNKSMDGIIEILRLRVNAETQFTNSLHKIIQSSSHILCTGLDASFSIRTNGFDALLSDMKNEYFQRMEFLNSLRKDVFQPCVQMKQIYEQKHKSLIYETKRNKKSLEKHQAQFLKLKEQYDKIMSKGNKGKKQQPIIQRRYSEKQIIWKQRKHSFDDQISSSMLNIQLIEHQRMNTLRDALTNCAAFITNLCANRNYDIQNLNQSMALIDTEKDLRLFTAGAMVSNSTQSLKQNKINLSKRPYAASFYAEFRRQSFTNNAKSTYISNI